MRELLRRPPAPGGGNQCRDFGESLQALPQRIADVVVPLRRVSDKRHCETRDTYI